MQKITAIPFCDTVFYCIFASVINNTPALFLKVGLLIRKYNKHLLI